MVSSIFTVAVTLFFLNVMTTTDVEASSGPYETIPYQCASGETVDRCNYGSGSCSVSGQVLCESEKN